MIQEQQKQGTGQETSGGRKKGQMSQMGDPVNGWQKQAPDGCGSHDSGGKSI